MYTFTVLCSRHGSEKYISKVCSYPLILYVEQVIKVGVRIQGVFFDTYILTMLKPLHRDGSIDAIVKIFLESIFCTEKNKQTFSDILQNISLTKLIDSI